MYNLQTQSTQINTFSNARASKYLRFCISENNLSNNILTLIQLKKGHALELKRVLDKTGNEKLQLLYKNCVVACVPTLLAKQIIRNQNKGIMYSIEIESIEKLLALSPHKLSLVLKSN